MDIKKVHNRYIYDLSLKQLKSLVLFQNLYRKRRNDVSELKSRVETISSLLLSIVMNITHNYEIGVIASDYYTDYMKQINNRVIAAKNYFTPILTQYSEKINQHITDIKSDKKTLMKIWS